MEKLGLGCTLSLACALASLALFDLAFFSPPYIAWWRLPAILILGVAAGLLHTAIFHAISPMYRQDPAATVNMGGHPVRTGLLQRRASDFADVLFLHRGRHSNLDRADSGVFRHGLRAHAIRST